MNARFVVVAGLVCSLGLSACSADRPAAPTVTDSTTSSAKGGAHDREITIQATVEKVDVKARRVSLVGFDGTKETVHVSDDVRNLDQMKQGDVVVVTYLQSIAFKVLGKGETGATDSSIGAIGRAHKGDKPGGVAGRTITVVAKILKLDRAHQTAKLRDTEGNVFEVDVQNPDNFDKVKVGESVEITYIEALAIDVQSAPGS